MPFATPASTMDVGALGVWVEGRYRVTPADCPVRRAPTGWRSRASRPGRNLAPTWDAPASRASRPTPATTFSATSSARFAVQHNDRDGGRVRQRTYFSGQLAYWF